MMSQRDTFRGRKKSKKIKEVTNATTQIVMIPVESILPSPAQPRKHFDEVDIVSLADSIRQHGLIQPITVRRAPKSFCEKPKYICVAGERRLRAYKMLGREEIPCILADISSSHSAELAIVENIMRKDLNMFEYAAALETLIETYELTQEELAIKMSTSQSNIANKLRLLRFSPREQAIILESSLTERHARSLLRLNNRELREKAAFYVAEHNLTVKETDRYIDALLSPLPEKKKKSDNYCADDFCKTLDKTLAYVKKRGVAASAERLDYETEIQFLIRIPK